MLNEQLINELGLMHLRHKNSISDAEPQAEPAPPAAQTQPKLDKNEFRLLVKMLQAINHDCQYDAIAYDGQVVKYQHPKKTLVFQDINLPDNQQVMNLSSLADILKYPETKRPVWEKLKTL